MGAIAGFVLGYVLGTKAGEKGWEELQASWRTLSSSEEMRDILGGALATTRDMIRQGAVTMSGRLSQGAERQPLRVA
jgi:hypothetical protein